MLSHPIPEKPAASLEERVEYSNATQFRKLFLNVVDQLHANTYLRYIITKRGEPRAVIMSFAAYNMLYRALRQVTAVQSAASPENAARLAMRQLQEDSESGGDSADRRSSVETSSLIERLNAVVEEVNDIRQLVGVGAQGVCDPKTAIRKPARTR